MTQTGGSEKEAANSIPLPLERAIFVRFWLWLGIVSAVAMALAGGAITSGALWINTYLAQVTRDANDAAKVAANSAVAAAVEDRISTIAARVDEAVKRASELHSQSFSLAAEMGRSTGASSEHLRIIRANLDESNAILNSLRTAASITLARPGGVLNQGEIATSLSQSTDFARLVALGFGGLLQGSVLAFDVPSCPDGWQPFTEANGRFIIGSGDSERTRRSFRSNGGQEGIMLTIEHLPAHTHETLVGVLDKTSPFGQSINANSAAIHGVRQAPAFLSNTGPAGRATPTTVPLMPPFFALTYCKKS